MKEVKLPVPRAMDSLDLFCLKKKLYHRKGGGTITVKLTGTRQRYSHLYPLENFPFSSLLEIRIFH